MIINKDKLIIDCLSIFEKLPNGHFISFSGLLREAVGKEEAIQIEKDYDMFKLLNVFMKSVKKAKIDIKWEFSHGEIVGLPYNIGFCKIDASKEVRSITLNYSYGCWGKRGELKRSYVVFSFDKIRYVTRSLDRPTQSNPIIEITVDPLARYDNFDLEDNCGYIKEFQEICSSACSFVNNRDMICDAIGACVVVTYQDGHKEKFNNQYRKGNKGFDLLCILAGKYKPNILRNESEEC